jgi:hypothetical protein
MADSVVGLTHCAMRVALILEFDSPPARSRHGEGRSATPTRRKSPLQQYWMVPSSHRAGGMRLARHASVITIGIFTSAYLVAAVLGLALTRDGAYILFKALDSGQPLIPSASARFINVPLEMPVILARSMTDDHSVLAAVFGLSYLLIPFVSLACSWWILRRSRPDLFIWAVVGIGLFSLPGQPFMVSEAMMSVQLAWPVLLAILAARLHEHWRIVAGLSALLSITHPFSIVLLGMLAVAVAVIPSPDPTSRASRLRWIAFFATLALLSAVRTVMGDLGTEHAPEATPDSLLAAYRNVMYGAPLAMVAIGYAGAIMLVVGRFLRAHSRGIWGLRLEVGAVGVLAAAGLVLVPWAADGHYWWKALDYRFVTLLVALPLMALAAIDAVIGRTISAGFGGVAWVRHSIALSQAVVVFLVLCALSLSFHNLQNDLASHLTPGAPGCISSGSMADTAYTPLTHWAVTSDSLLIQAGRRSTSWLRPAPSTSRPASR